ncbi:hypothetical protein [Actinospongicola halichondriae]|uniref:hypothetical protein n=1 Tax=Actinospongicola halichondriae TaxID=3236844 RepID=UPI003D4D00A7
MGWFRRSRPARTTDAPQPEAPETDVPAPDGTALVPLTADAAPALARTERALQMLATQSAQLHTSIVHLEHRVDAMSAAMQDRFDAASHEDVIKARLHTAKVAAELSRLEINVAARIEQVRGEVRGAAEIDLRHRTPVDTGF